MPWGEIIRVAFRTLNANRLRSALTVLGTGVAVLSIVAVVSILHGADVYVASQIMTSGSNTFTLTTLGFTMDPDEWLEFTKRRDLRVEDAAYLAERLTLADAVVPRETRSLEVKQGSRRSARSPIWGVGADYPLVGDFEIEHGRHLTRSDVEGRASVAVLGAKLAEKLMPAGQPIGQSVRVGRHRYVVVGVLKAQGGGAIESRDGSVFVPITTLQKQFGRGGSIEILVHTADPDWMEEAQDEAALQLKLRRGLRPYDEPDFSILTDEQFFELYQNFTRLFFGALVGIVSLSLVIGGIVIMNIMLVSVAERTREIGIRKAIGARSSHIVAQFVIESILLAGGGGLAGASLGAATALLVDLTTPFPAAVQPWSVLIGLLLAIGVGGFFGIYPARRASQLSPIAALRSET